MKPEPNPKRGSPIPVRLDTDIEDEIRKIADATGLSQVEVMRQALRAGTKAIKANGYKMTLPLEFQVSDSCKETERPISAQETNKKGGERKTGS